MSLCLFLLELVLAANAWTTDFSFTPVDGPSALATEIHGINHAGQLVGAFRDANGTHGFVCTPPVNASCTTPFIKPFDVWINGAKAAFTQAQGITTAGQIAGFFGDFKGEGHGFLCASSSTNRECRQIDVAMHDVLMANTQILGIEQDGLFVGTYRDLKFNFHGFLYAGGHFTRVDVPDAPATVPYGIATPTGNAPTTIVGFFLDTRGAIHGFLCTLPVSPGCFIPFDVTLNGTPQATTQAVGINSQNQIVGFFQDAKGSSHGFLCALPLSAVCFTQLDARKGTETQIRAISHNGQIVGGFLDTSGFRRGFVAPVSSFGARRKYSSMRIP